eukprot:TRINITY_DN93935_c0_g1_i1.p1 TRINITY_DN93935_c0_g1~~TRINITY_DN93935_c0_g1_i1.p1  ORF type:complete len:580 (-),score=116.21 TRINITY_DN93935_c0_g1_i1:111-1850(-)
MSKLSPQAPPANQVTANGMPALRGIVLVAQLHAQKARVVYVYEPESDNESRPDERPVAAGGVPVFTGADIGVTGPPVRQTSGDTENRPPCFGIDENEFSTFMLPDYEELWNKELHVRRCSGQMEMSGKHGPYSHLKLVSFPCNVAGVAFPSDGKKYRGRDKECRDEMWKLLEKGSQFEKISQEIQAKDLVLRFNIVCVVDTLMAADGDKKPEILCQVSSHLARALVAEEKRVGYLSREVKRLLHAQEPSEGKPVTTSEGLDEIIKKMFVGIRSNGTALVRVNNLIDCPMLIFPKEEVTFPTAEQALMWTERTVLRGDFARHVEEVLEHASPTKSLQEMSHELGMPFETVQRAAGHLIYHRRARAVDVFDNSTRVGLATNVDVGPKSVAAEKFREWNRSYRSRHSLPEVTYAEAVAACAECETVLAIKNWLSDACPGVDTRRILDWFIAENLLVQLGTFYHFLPTLAVKGARPTAFAERDLDRRVQAVRSKFPTLSERELKLLASRCDDVASSDEWHMSHLAEGDLWFLCKFVEEVVRANRRTDGPWFKVFCAGFEKNVDYLQDLLKKNSDILVPYICRC